MEVDAGFNQPPKRDTTLGGFSQSRVPPQGMQKDAISNFEYQIKIYKCYLKQLHMALKVFRQSLDKFDTERTTTYCGDYMTKIYLDDLETQLKDIQHIESKIKDNRFNNIYFREYKEKIWEDYKAKHPEEPKKPFTRHIIDFG